MNITSSRANSLVAGVVDRDADTLNIASQDRWSRVGATAITCLTVLGLGLGGWRASAQAPRFTTATTVGDSLMLTWSGNAFSYDIQKSTSLTAPNWEPAITTARTNVLMPISGTATFFRVLSSVANPPAIQVTTSNLATGESFLAIVQPQTNANLWVRGPTNFNGGDAIVCQENELQGLDVAWDGGGGFRFLDRNGAPTLSGGFFLINQGPGANQVTYSGVMTNPVGSASFSAVTTIGTAGRVQAQDDLTQDLGRLKHGLTTAEFFMSPEEKDCPPIIAVLKQQFTATCPLQAASCAFNFPPKSSYCRFIEVMTLKTNTVVIDGKTTTYVRAVVCGGYGIKGCCGGPGWPDPDCK